MKKLTFIFIILIMLTALLVSCGGDTIAEPNNAADPAAGNESPAENAGTPDDNLTVQVTDDLGEFDFGGYEFTMLTRANPRYHHELSIEELTGEVLNDAVYKRSRTLEERFNFTFAEQLHTADGGDSVARRSISAGDNAHDIITLHISVLFPLAQDGLLHPVINLPHLDLNKPYWNRQLNSDLSIIGKQFFAFGAHNLSTYDFTRMLLFNKQMLADFGLDNPYELVKAGKWTFERFEEMSKSVIADLNGDGNMDRNDRFGYLASYNQVLPNFWLSAGTRSIAKDNNGVPYSAMNGEEFISVFTRIFEMTWDNNSWFGPGIDDLTGVFENMFENNQGLFLDTTFYYIHRLRAMETDFGILPYPKLTESQEAYFSRIEGASAATVPITADSAGLERASVILEAMASESLKEVIPAYYDVVLSVRTARDEESSEMLDIIFASRIFDLGDGLWFGDIRNGALAPMFSVNNRDIVSRLERLENIIQRLSDNAVAAFETVD